LTISGILNVNKPAGVTSFDVVRLIKKVSRQRRVGHGGTLDPTATGVLLILLGRATRVAEYLLKSTKTYRALVELGVTTDSYDAAGSVLTRTDPSGITKGAVEEVLCSFRGLVSQEPPMFSAIRFQGHRLYELARRGEVVPRKRRQRIVYRLNLVEWAPPLLTVELECEEGFYVRSFAHDLGQRLGCGGYLKSLCRLRQGDFAIQDALSIDEVRAVFEAGLWPMSIYPPDSVLLREKAVVLGEEKVASLVRGKVLKFFTHQKPGDQDVEAWQRSGSSAGELCRAYSISGDFLGVGCWKAENGVLYPEKVFYPASPANF
jgi:tRNA pseudouridine55 synthase